MTRGFSLIELLIVVSVITTLSVIGATIYSSVLKNSKDQARHRDLTTISQSLELYRGNQHYYPTDVSFGGTLQSA